MFAKTPKSKLFVLLFFTYCFFAGRTEQRVCLHSNVKFVYKGEKDKLAIGYLDNYSKAILDITTKSIRVWKDDKQDDEIHVI